MCEEATAGPKTGWQRWVSLVARLVLGAVLVVAGALKLPSIDASINSVRAYKLLPFELTALVGTALPIVEIVIGLMLITGTFTRVAAVLGSGLMLAFIIGISSVWARGISIDCGCFAPGGAVDPSQTQYPLEIARDLGLLALGAWTIWRPASPFALDSWLFAGAEPTTDDDQENPR